MAGGEAQRGGARVTVPDPYGLAQLRRPALFALPTAVAAEEGVFVYGTPALLWQAETPPTWLSDRDEDIDAPMATTWPGDARRARARSRRIDTLHAHDALATLVLADPEATAAMLRGAATTLATAAPDLLIDFRGAAPPCLPARYTARLLAPGLLWASTRRHAPPALPGPAVWACAADAALTCGGLHPPDPAPEGRWTGAPGAHFIALPRPFGGAFTLTLDVPGGTAAFPVGIDGATIWPGPGGAACYAIAIDPARSAVLRVALFPPRPVADRARPPRKLGVRLLGLTLRPA